MIKTSIKAAALLAVTLAVQSVSAQTPEPATKDSDLVDRVRRSVVADRDLSAHAAKIVIVSSNGEVRLSGLVQNEGEKAQIGAKAAAVAGNQHVTNDLRVMTNVPDGSGLRRLLEQASMPRTTVTAAN